VEATEKRRNRTGPISETTGVIRKKHAKWNKEHKKRKEKNEKANLGNLTDTGIGCRNSYSDSSTSKRRNYWCCSPILGKHIYLMGRAEHECRHSLRLEYWNNPLC
jgi:hypothetical protein